MTNPEIRFVKNADIDYEKWDKCITNSPFGMFYAKSWFLDRICSHWDALILADYLYIMPLVNNRKFGMNYIFQPFFTQQLGVFSVLPVESKIVNQFLKAIPKKFRLIDMKLNWGNQPTTDTFQIKTNTNYHLDLRSDLQDIQNHFNTNTQRNIRKAVQNGVQVSFSCDLDTFIKFTQHNLADKSPEVRDYHFQALQNVVHHSLNQQTGEIYCSYDSDSKLIASAFFVRSDNRCTYLAASSNEKGINRSAMFLLIDAFIKNNAGRNLVLDFEGSNIEGVARFYSGFGAIPQTYYSVHQNRLPKIFRIFKK